MRTLSKRRRFWHGLRCRLRRTVGWPVVLLRHYMLSSSVVEEVAGIRLAQLHLNETNEALFVRATQDALAWLEKDDPRRFRRVQREIRFICNEPCISLGEYERRVRRCGVDIDHYKLVPDSAEYRWFLARYVGTLVHEATHGYLDSQGFPYLRDNRLRLERICRSEEQRAVARLQSERYDFTRQNPIPDFDEQWFRRHIEQGWAERTGALMRRGKEAYRSVSGDKDH